MDQPLHLPCRAPHIPHVSLFASGTLDYITVRKALRLPSSSLSKQGGDYCLNDRSGLGDQNACTLAAHYNKRWWTKYRHTPPWHFLLPGLGFGSTAIARGVTTRCIESLNGIYSRYSLLRNGKLGTVMPGARPVYRMKREAAENAKPSI